MKRKFLQAIYLLLILVLFSAYSCIDETYDLNKVSKDITVGGDQFAIPLGSTDSIKLNGLLDTSDLITLNNQGQYSINLADQFDPVSLSIDAVTINIADVNIDPIEVSFDAQTLDDFTLDAMNTTTPLNMPPVNITDNLVLPIITSLTTTDEFMDPPVTEPGVPLQKTIKILPTEIAIAFDYDLVSNEQVKTIHTIYFGENNSGQKIDFNIDKSQINAVIDKPNSVQTIKSFSIVFPPGFELAEDNTSPFANEITVTGNQFTVSNAVLNDNADITVFSFYIKSLTLNASSNISYNDVVTYQVEYILDGVSNGTDFDKLTVKVYVDTQLQFDYAEITTEEIGVTDFTPGSIDINSTIDGLDDIRSVGLVTFNPSSQLNIQLEDPNLPLDFISGNLIVTFPSFMSFDESQSSLDGSSLVGNTLSIPSTRLFDSNIILTIKSMDLSGYPPVNNSIDLTEKINYDADNLLLGSKKISTTELEGIEQKSITINLPETAMSIENAVITTNSITASVEQTTELELNEEVPAEISSIQSISLNEGKPSQMVLKFNFDQLPSGIDELTFDNFTILFPPYLTFAESDNVVDGLLTITGAEATFNPTRGFSKTLTITGFDFTAFNGGTGVVTQMVDDKNMLIINTNNEIKINGDVKAIEATINSDELNNIIVSPSVSIDPLQIAQIEGILDPQIAPMEKTVSLNLGSNLDFLKNDAVLNIHNPQILLTLNNTIGVPIDLTMSLSANDANGAPIAGSEIQDITFQVKAAEVDGEPTVSKFIISSQGTAIEGYESIQVENLSDLLTVIPDMVSFKLTAISDKTTTHHVDLTKAMEIYGSYEIIVPLRFDDISINYKDTIVGLGEKIAGLADVINKVGVELNMNIENAIPLVLNLNVSAMDSTGVLIEGITTEVSDIIPAGSGTETATKNITVSLSSENGSLSNLDALILNVSVTANETVGGVPLNADQFLRLSDMYMLINGGLNLNLNDN